MMVLVQKVDKSVALPSMDSGLGFEKSLFGGALTCQAHHAQPVCPPLMSRARKRRVTRAPQREQKGRDSFPPSTNTDSLGTSYVPGPRGRFSHKENRHNSCPRASYRLTGKTNIKQLITQVIDSNQVKCTRGGVEQGTCPATCCQMLNSQLPVAQNVTLLEIRSPITGV